VKKTPSLKKNWSKPLRKTKSYANRSASRDWKISRRMSLKPFLIKLKLNTKPMLESLN